MPVLSKKALSRIIDSFDKSTTSVYQRRELAQVIKTQRQKWKLPENMYFTKLLGLLMAEGYLNKIELHSESYKGKVRYTWGESSPYSISLSLKAGAYLSHGSAVFLHSLNDQLPKAIYVNKEQTPKPSPTGSLSQEAIDRAFANKQRSSNYIFTFDQYRCILLSGKYTDNLGIITLSGANGNTLPLTSIERTLVDIAVRPAYAGGIYQVAAAYKGAKGKISVGNLVSILKKLDYKYPYHQTIGFYLKRAGFQLKELQELKTLGMDYNFYIDYGISKKNLDYDEEWRLFFPKGF
jgi:predicted transcriptional regulator of viral defense system